MSEPIIILYAIRNQKGEYFHAKGYTGHGNTWVSNLTNARIYPRRAPARSIATFFSKKPEEYGVAQVVELHVTAIVAPAEEEQRTIKAVNRIKADAIKSELWHKQQQLEQAQRALQEAQKTIAELSKE